MKVAYKQNIGTLDRMVRLCAGIILMILGMFVITETAGLAFMILSIPLLITGITGFCPGYTLLGITTKRQNSCC